MLGIRYVSFLENSGYGEAGRRNMLALRRLGVRITWTPMVRGRGWGRGFGYEPFRGESVGDPELDALCNASIPYDVLLLHLPPEYYPRWASAAPGKTLVGCTVWETNKLPRHWPPLLNTTDLLLVPSNWNREVFRESGVTSPIRVVPHCLPAELPASQPWSQGVGRSDYVFYTINVWSERKAVRDTIEVYLRTFTEHDQVALIVKTSAEDLSHGFVPFGGQRLLTSRRAANRTLKRHKHSAKVSVITETLSGESILALHERGNCYVSLCRSEGWGLGAFDAAARGKPVIMTGYGGQREFLPGDSAYLVDYRLVAVRAGFFYNSYTPDQRWAQADLGHAARLMRGVFEDPDEGRRRGAALKRHVEARFGAESVARQLLESLS